MATNIPPKSKERELDALKMFKELTKKHVRTLKTEDFKTGNMVTYAYNAKDKEKVYDKTPLTMVLWRTSSYTLGLNFHWIPRPLRYIVVEFILKNNVANIKAGADLKVSYKMLKPLLIKLKLVSVIRLYINARISKKGIRIPPELFRKAADLPSESFIGMSAERAYALQTQAAKKRAMNRNMRKPKPSHKSSRQKKKEAHKKGHK